MGIILVFGCLLFVMYCSFSGFFFKNIIRSYPGLIARVHSKNVQSGGLLIANNSDWFVFVPLTDRYHRCGSGFYRYQSSVCDGFQDCADQSDESNCKYPDQT